MNRRSRFAFATVVLVATVVFAGCKSSPSGSSAPLSACTSCVAAQCKLPTNACAADADCAAIDACVNATSPCAGANADNPLCDDDCIKAACAAKYPAGLPLYIASQNCQNGAQCNMCEKVCEPLTTPMQKCIANEACDLAAPTPESCKCSPPDAGQDSSSTVGSDASTTTACLHPTCQAVTAAAVNAILGTAITGPVTKDFSSGDVKFIQCHYDPDAGAVNEPYSVQIAYWSPFTRADFDAARANSVDTAGVSTADVTGVGDAAYTQVPPGTNPNHVQTLIVLSGCVQIEIVSNASDSQNIALAKKILSLL